MVKPANALPSNASNTLDDEGFPVDPASMIARARSSKSVNARVWQLSQYYLLGRQNVFYDDRSRRFAMAQSSTGQNYVVANQTLNIYRTVAARLETAYPSITIMPAAPSSAQIVRAETSELAIKYYWHTEEMEQRFARLIDWLLVAGSAAFHTVYDPSDQKIHTSVKNPHDIFFEAGAITPEESEFVALRTFVLKSEVKRAYPAKTEAIDKLTAAQRDAWTGPTLDPANLRFQSDRLEMFDVYFQDGRYGVLIGDQWFFKGRTPGNVVPVQYVRYTRIPGEIWGLGLIASLIDLQAQYNKFRSLIQDNAEMMGNPKWRCAKTSQVASGAFAGPPGSVIYYNAAGGPGPEPIPMPGLPAYVLDNIRQLQSEIFDVSGIHSVTLGKRAVGLDSGAAIKALNAQDVSQLQITQNEIERAAKGVAETTLTLMRAYYTEPRMIQMFNSAGKFIWQELANTDLVETPQVFIEPGSLFRANREDREQRVLNMLQLGLVTPAQAKKQILLKSFDADVFERVEAMNHARQMLVAVRAGGDIEIYADDNLEAFSDVFREFMRSPNFYSTPPDTQTHVRDIFVACSTYQPPPPVPGQSLESRGVVYPPPPPPPVMPPGLQAVVPSQGQTEGVQAAAMPLRGQTHGKARQPQPFLSTIGGKGIPPGESSERNVDALYAAKQGGTG